MRREQIHWVLSLAYGFILSACGTSGGESGWTVMVDTLPTGVIRVVNTPPAAEPEPTWTLEEELRIGSIDEAGPTVFGLIKGIAVAPDGRIAVLDAQAQELRIFDSAGGHLATFGGEGAGPGEFEGAFGLMQSADGMLWVPDHTNGRMSVLDPERGFVNSYSMRFFSYGFVWNGEMGVDGRIFKPSIMLGPSPKNVLRVYSPEMVLLDSLPLPDPPESDPKDPPGSFYWEAPGGLPRGYMSVPFYASGKEVVDSRGLMWSSERGDPSYRIKRWIPGGDTLLIVETRRPPVAVSQAERDSVVAALREELRELGGARQDWSKIPRVKPAVRSIFLAEDGRVWVETSSPDALRRYDVYRPDGRHVGTVATSLKIFLWVSPVVRGDRFWAVTTDELGVAYVIRARLVPAGENRGT